MVYFQEGPISCLHADPTFYDSTDDADNGEARIYGTQFQSSSDVPSLSSNDWNDVVCAVCQSTGDTYVQMGRHTCDNGDITEYYGYVVSGQTAQSVSTQQ